MVHSDASVSWSGTAQYTNISASPLDVCGLMDINMHVIRHRGRGGGGGGGNKSYICSVFTNTAPLQAILCQ